jgi:hypothetical protein
MQPTHLYLHSNPMDYPETAKRKNQFSNSEWDQTVVITEAFRAPMFIPGDLKKHYNAGKFNLFVDREKYNGTDEEYEQQLPGQFMDKWVTELQTVQIVRFIDELNTPENKIPQYLNV